MIHSPSVVLLVSQILRQAGVDYYEGKDKIEGWKEEYLKTKKKSLLKKMNIFWCAEEFWFDFDEFGDSPADAFWEKYQLDLLGDAWDINNFRYKVLRGQALFKAPNRGGDYVNNTGDEQVVGQEVLLNRGDWERGELGGSGNGGAFRTSSGDCPASLGKAVELAGCVC